MIRAISFSIPIYCSDEAVGIEYSYVVDSRAGREFGNIAVWSSLPRGNILKMQARFNAQKRAMVSLRLLCFGCAFACSACRWSHSSACGALRKQSTVEHVRDREQRKSIDLLKLAEARSYWHDPKKKDSDFYWRLLLLGTGIFLPYPRHPKTSFVDDSTARLGSFCHEFKLNRW